MACNCVAPYIGPTLANLCYGGSYIPFMALIDIIIRGNCDISESCQRVIPKLKPDPEYDFVVIGGGAAGSAVAGRLTEISNWKVLLLEAGSDEPPGVEVPSMWQNFINDPEVNWGYLTEPQKYACLGNKQRRCLWPRAKMLGGCGSYNGMMYMRGLPKNYNDWAENGNPGWSYDDVLKYFLKSERNQQIGTLVNGDIHGADGPMSISRFPDHPELAEDVLAAAEEIGYPVVNDLNDGNFTGFTIAQASNSYGVRVSSARAFLRPVRDRPNLHVMLNSTATKIILDTEADPKKISAVEFVFREKIYRVKVTKEVILSAGTINSPQLLLLSGIGPKNELDKVGIEQVHALPGVGKNLQNHVAFTLSINLNKLKDTNDLDWVALTRYVTTQTGPMSSTGMAQVTARLTTPYGESIGDNHDLQFYFGGFTAGCCRTCRVGELETPGDFCAPKTFTISAICMRPRSRGYIGLHTNNPLDPPLMDPNYLSQKYEVNVLIAGIRIAQKLANSTILRKKYGSELVRKKYGKCAHIYEYDSDLFWECAIRYETGPENHQAGSCKMGPSSDPLAVVDSELQVHGLEGVRVIDASIMPTVISGNIHATTVMIGEKGADYIKQKWLNENTD